MTESRIETDGAHPPRATLAAIAFTLRPSRLPCARTALVAIAFWKLAILLLILAVHIFLTDSPRVAADAGIESPSFLSHFEVWDSRHYLLLAEGGYSEGLRSNAFPPLYPFAISVVDVVAGDAVISGLIVSNLASAAGLYLLFAFVSWRFNSRVALRALLLFLAFPTAFYLNLIYTEGLFLLLTMVFFVFLYRGQIALAAAISILIPLTRYAGVMTALPFAVFLIEESWRTRSGEVFAHMRSLVRPQMLYLLAPALGYLLAHLYLQITTDDFFAAEHALSGLPNQWSAQHLLQPGRFLGQLLSSNITGESNQTLDRLAFLGLICSLPFVFSRVDRTLFAYCLIFAAIPLLGGFTCYTRYVMLAFPLYIVGALILERRSKLYLSALVAAGLLSEAVFISMHVRGYWVA